MWVGILSLLLEDVAAPRLEIVDLKVFLGEFSGKNHLAVVENGLICLFGCFFDDSLEGIR